MDQKLASCLNGTPSTEHIFPFFWQHGESHEVLLAELEAIEKSGVREFCVESRPHEQFGQEAWWEDFGFLLREAKKRNMRLWLLDDKHFPTGYANGIMEKYPDLRMISLRMEYRDFSGPQNDCAVVPVELQAEEQFVSVVAYRREDESGKLVGEGIDLLKTLENDLLWWDIPEGIWRVFYIIRTRKVCSPWKEPYIDVMSEASCRLMLEAVYEPHYAHFAEYFGNTFAGFFSDEPSFSNDWFCYDSALGKPKMLIPWNDEVPALIGKRNGKTAEENKLLLPALWQEIEGKTALLREPYMETATELYSKNFCWMLGDWCRAHGVLYIGHIIEDMNAHQRLGYGAGHYFRSLDGQDMGGIDIVLHQIIRGQTELDHTASVCGEVVSPTFFHYLLPKLAPSHSHIQPLKKNRAMCEVFGAFGWAEGVPLMKYLADLMLVNGVNYFVPHGFSPKYPDYDCPPQFYAHGMNAHFPLFGQLMGYMHRVTHLLTDGIHQARAAVYYNAEAEWAGGKRMLQQEVCKALVRSHVDFDIIPQDILPEATVQNGSLHINQEDYRVLVVPYSQYLPNAVIEELHRLSESGLAVWFMDALPESAAEGQPLGERLKKCTVLPFERLAETAVQADLCGIRLKKADPYVRFYHIIRNGQSFFMLWNEDIYHTFDGEIEFPANGTARIYNAWRNRCYTPEQIGSTLRIKLAPEESLIVCFGEEMPAEAFDYGDRPLNPLHLDWQVSVCKTGAEEYLPIEGGLGNLAKQLPQFNGRIRYEAILHSADGSEQVLSLGKVGETAELWLNDVYCGAEIAEPYRFEIRDQLRVGENRIRIETVVNLGYWGHDMLSSYLPLPPMGLIGPVCIG